jgi:hypothetical protein
LISKKANRRRKLVKWPDYNSEPDNLSISMSDIDEKLVELMKKTAKATAPTCAVPKEDWSYSEVRRGWSSWSEEDREDFSREWSRKRTWNSDDVSILELLMAEANDLIWEYACTQVLLKYPNRERAVRFLIELISKQRFQNEPLNYIQVLGMFRHKSGAEAVRPFYEKYRKALEAEATTGVPEDVVFGPLPYHPYFVAAGAMFEITCSAEYELAVRRYFDHPNEQVRWWAENVLGVEGPTTLRRKELFMKFQAE